MKARKPIPRKRATPRRSSVMRDRDYLEWLNGQICVACRLQYPEADLRYLARTACVPAHGPSAGMRVKGPDNEALPLCCGHHYTQHAIGYERFELKYGFYWRAIAKEHYARYLKEKGTA